MLFAAFATQSEAQNFRFNSVQVEGNERIETSTIVSYTGIARGQSLTGGELNDAYQRVVDSGLFESVEFDPRGGTLVIRVQEFPTVNSISFEGNKRLDDDVLSEIVESTSRRVFDPSQAERDASAIAQAYSQQGRISAAVTPRIIRRSDNRVDLIYEISEGSTTEVERISFVGNKAFSDRRLRRILQTKQATILRALFRSDTLIEDRLEFDRQVLRDFYLSRGYVDFRVLSTNAELTRERDAFFLVVNVEEGQQFKFGQITTVSEIPGVNAADYQNALRIKPGVVYSPSLVESSIARMERLAIRQGVDFLRVEPRITRNDRDLTLNVEFGLVRGPRVFIERIDIEGNTTTLDRVVRQQFKVVEGDPFNPREIRQSAERIRALGFFSTADVEAREGSSQDKVVIDVDVEEQPTGSLQLGGSFSTNDGFGVALGLSEDNFLGRGQRLSFNVSTAQESQQYVLGFTEPYLLGRDLAFNVDLGFMAADSSFANYDTERTFFNPSLSFPISDRSNIGLRYGWSSSTMLSRGVSATGQELTGFTIANEIATGRQRTSLLGLSYTYDSRLTRLNPNAGFLFEIGADFAGLGGDNEYISTRARAIAQTRVLNEEVTLRATIEGGALTWRGSNNSRVVDRFQLGPSQMRGFEPQGIGPREIVSRCVPGSTCDVNAGTGSIYTTNDSLGGNLFAVARFEAEFPLGLPEEIGLKGSVFYDIGNLWNLDNVNTSATGGCGGTTCSQSIVGSTGSFRQVVGFGLIWDSALGPLRLNFTNAISKETFDNEQTFDLTVSARF
ncbi:MAG: outer membrane protein assembly factor BamA [Paracoccaceae bacterium]